MNAVYSCIYSSTNWLFHVQNHLMVKSKTVWFEIFYALSICGEGDEAGAGSGASTNCIARVCALAKYEEALDFNDRNVFLNFIYY